MSFESKSAASHGSENADVPRHAPESSQPGREHSTGVSHADGPVERLLKSSPGASWNNKKHKEEADREWGRTLDNEWVPTLYGDVLAPRSKQ